MVITFQGLLPHSYFLAAKQRKTRAALRGLHCRTALGRQISG